MLDKPFIWAVLVAFAVFGLFAIFVLDGSAEKLRRAEAECAARGLVYVEGRNGRWCLSPGLSLAPGSHPQVETK